MRELRVAALVAAAVGLGVFAVGCGPLPSTSADTSKVAKGTENAVAKATEKAGQVGELAGKVEAATKDIKKELEPLTKALDTLKEKINTGEKEAGTDVAKQKAVGMLKETRDKVEAFMKDINDKIGGLAGLKDIKGLDDAKKAIMELIEKVKPLLKDYMPK